MVTRLVRTDTAMKIKKADLTKTRDLLQLSVLDKSCFPDDSPEPKVGNWWILWDRSKAVGFIGGHYKNGYYRLTRVGVIQSYRGKKLAHRLLKSIIRHSYKQNYVGIRTYTSFNNVPSINTLIGRGFKMIGTMKQEGQVFIRWQLLL